MSETKNPGHDILSTFHWCEGERDGVYYRIASYDADAGKLGLEDAENLDTGSVANWLLKALDSDHPAYYDVVDPHRVWVNQDAHCEEPGDVCETGFRGAARCRECGTLFGTKYPDDEYCGCP